MFKTCGYVVIWYALVCCVMVLCRWCLKHEQTVRGRQRGAVGGASNLKCGTVGDDDDVDDDDDGANDNFNDDNNVYNEDDGS